MSKIMIGSLSDLKEIGNSPAYPLDAEYELTQDIDASDTMNWNGGAGFAPIGTASNPFTGKFDGKGHKITGLYINRPNEDNVGLFGVLFGEVRDLEIENGTIISLYTVGILTGTAYRACIAYVTCNACSISGLSENIIAGKLLYSSLYNSVLIPC